MTMLMFVLACCLFATAQSGMSGDSMKKDNMKDSKMMGKTKSMTGCVAEKDGAYMLMTKAHPDGVQLMSSEDLKPHVGHKVQAATAGSSGCRQDESGEPLIAVIIPAYNEEKSIAHVLSDIPPRWVHTVLVVDNGSSDGTAERARSHGATVVPEPRRGYGSACLAGIASLEKVIEVIVFLDADYSDFPEELEKLAAPILRGRADMVIGTRMHDRATRCCLTPQQRFGNWLATLLMRWFWGFRYSDLGPFRAIRRKSLELLEMEDRNFGWTVEMQIKAVQKRLRIVEVPVQYRVRIGRSKISGTVKGTILAGSKILYTVFRYALTSGQVKQR